MRLSLLTLSFLSFASALACNTADPQAIDAGSGDAALGDAALGDAALVDVQSIDANPSDAATDAAAPPTCTPTPGTDDVRVSCADFELAIMVNGDGTSTANLTGHLFGFDEETACATVDEVEVLTGGETITTWTGAGVVGESRRDTLLASGPVASEMTERCDSATDRFGGFGFLIRGRIAGGTFEARCADAESGYRWPPALRVTCHENIDAVPSSSNDAEVRTVSSATTFTTFNIRVPHGPGGALLTIDPDMTVITGAYMAGTLEPLSVTGVATIFENDAPAGVETSVDIRLDDSPLTEEHCPTPDVMPDLPVMLLQFSGTGERGAFSTEAYVENCNRIAMP